MPGLGEGFSSMQGILSDPGVSGRALAALLLGKEKDVATLQALREALMDKDASVRAAAVHSMALRNDPMLQPDLVPLLDDKKESVRLRAATGYLRLQMIRKSEPTRGENSGNGAQFIVRQPAVRRLGLLSRFRLRAALEAELWFLARAGHLDGRTKS